MRLGGEAMEPEEAPARPRVAPDETRLLLLRHGQTDGNRQGLLLGITDVPLNAAGRLQALQLGRWLALHERIDVLYSSLLARAHETATIICRELGVGLAHHLEANLGEINFGEAEGVLAQELATRFPHLAAYVDHTLPDHPDWQWPGGDWRLAYYQRVVDTVDRIAAGHRGQTVALVTHGGVITGYLHWISRRILGFSREFVVENCSVTELRHRADGMTVVCIGATGHTASADPDGIRPGEATA